MPFEAFIGSAYERYVLPIIPRGSKMSPYSTLTEDRLGKIPGWKYDTGWGGFPKSHPWQGFHAKPHDLHRWPKWFKDEGKPETVGLQARIFPAVDIDWDNREIADQVWRLACDVFGTSIMRYRANSGKILMPLRWDEHSGPPPKKRRALYQTPDGEQGAVELLGDGQHYVVEGMHPSGVPYEWVFGNDMVKGFDDIPVVTAEKIDEFYSRLHEAFTAFGFTLVKGGGVARGGFEGGQRVAVGPDHPDLCPDLGMLTDVLTNYLPADHHEFATYDEWAAMCVAIATACGKDEDYYDEFLAWCSTVPDNDEAMIRGKWESVRDSSVGWSYICQIAHDYGYYGDVQDQFPPLQTEDDLTPALPRASLDGSYEGVIADHFVVEHAGKTWIFVPKNEMGSTGIWYRFTDGVWRVDHTVLHEVGRLLERVGQAIRNRANATPADMRQARALYSTHMAEAVVRRVRAHPAMQRGIIELDAQPIVFGIPGGHINAAGEICEADPSLLITKRTAVRPDFNARCPLFESMVLTLANRDPAVAKMIWRLLGVTLSGTCYHQLFVFMHGRKGNEGKTTFTQIIHKILGDYARSIRNTVFVKGGRGDDRFSLASLQGYRFTYSNEIENGHEWASAKLKEATGGGTMEIERKGIMAEQMALTNTMWFTGNYLPIFPPADEAMRRRMVLIEHEIRLTKEEARGGHAQRVFEAEGPAILARMIEEMVAYLETGDLLVPDEVTEAVTEHFQESDPIYQFITERLAYGAVTVDALVSKQDVFEDYVAWARNVAQLKNILGRTHFYRRFEGHYLFEEQGWQVKRDRIAPDGYEGSVRHINPVHCYKGFALRYGGQASSLGCVGNI